VELFRYDSEEFWFRDGHLLLRGNNGTGKSKVLSLTLPFLLDAQLKPSRVEPDGDSSKKMAWNLLMSSHNRRNGYAWIEFGRVAEDGTARYLSLGAGLSAAAARSQVDSWYFILDDAVEISRINQDLWLTSDQRVVLTKDRLRDALKGRGHVFDTATSYRRAVDERLFRLGTKRYDALMDTLIQLRQPQLSRKPDETALSNALTEALPPLAPELLGDVAEALGQLEEDRRQLEEYHSLAKAIERFEQRYRIYAGTQTRRQARALRHTQTEFDTASRARSEAQARLQKSEADAADAKSSCDDAELVLKREQARLETLREGPAMQDANRLATAEKDATARQRAFESASVSVEETARRLARSTQETEDARGRVGLIERQMVGHRRESASHADIAGIASTYSANPLATLEPAAVAELTPRAFESASSDLQAPVAARRDEIAVLRRRHGEVKAAEDLHSRRQQTRDERSDDAEAAAQRRKQADLDVESEGQNLIAVWDRHFSGLTQLTVSSDASNAALEALADWVHTLQGENPARLALEAAQQDTNLRHARIRVDLEGNRQTLNIERATLEEERQRLEDGSDATPPPPYTRDAGARNSREGAPLWQLVDFQEQVADRERSGVEAALEVAGLLDAWVSPDGRLQSRDGSVVLQDVQALERRQVSLSLLNWLKPAVPADCKVPAHTVERLLSSIACSEDDPIDVETWVAPDGRFRLGALGGAWRKPEAVYIGYAARAASRARRLAAIATRLTELGDELAAIEVLAEQLTSDQDTAADEWRLAPIDIPLRNAHVIASARAREAQIALDRLSEADIAYQDAENALRMLRQQLAIDALDLRLPETVGALSAIETALEQYRQSQFQLCYSLQNLRSALPDLIRQQGREHEARDDLEKLEVRRAAARLEAEEASARFKVLRKSVGAKVEELNRQLAAARAAVETGEENWKLASGRLRDAGEARAVARVEAATANSTFQGRSDARAGAVLKFQRFAATGLLLAAWPNAELPNVLEPWTIDPALGLARRAEQALSALKDDDDAWTRVQREITGDLTELQRALSALGQQAQSDTTDWGLIVHVIYQNRPERPDSLALRLVQEIAERSEVLTAKERTVLENHLQAEIASEIQRLLQGAEAQRIAINNELYKRPTTTGVRYRLLWQPLAEEEGAPVGLEAARKRLLNTNADLWSAEDRGVVGAMLQQRIAAERERADSSVGKDGSGSLLDQLARALDYRRWHRFRVERWQDENWRKLSGPASSGERALGLTVPLFAAVASFYSQGNYNLAPRLMLLDEAFAGIDDAARAHCMALIREFDLDFVITSEREWACYSELPGVSICQLQRREGIDAVFVSRWTWDGRAKTLEADPDRRFAPT
jgi:uncharacterized protein (TIGR02680 family)